MLFDGMLLMGSDGTQLDDQIHFNRTNGFTYGKKSIIGKNNMIMILTESYCWAPIVCNLITKYTLIYR